VHPCNLRPALGRWSVCTTEVRLCLTNQNKTKLVTNVDKDLEKSESTDPLVRDIKLGSQYGKQYGTSSKY
jgi:hypothetical protein